MLHQLHQLHHTFQGLLFYDNSAIHQAQLMAYSTDASVYQQKPLAVAIPKNQQDIQTLIQFATKNKITLIPRAAGTSLAGQVVGNGIVVDISKFFISIIKLNEKEKWVTVQPGVIRDDLNAYLKPFGLMFGPETSTANRAMIGGMLGNNSCGLHSIVWGSVRENIIAIKGLLSDGSEVIFKAEENWHNGNNSFQKKIYENLNELLSNPHHQQLIQENFPQQKVHRRNSGYALDSLLKMQPFTTNGETFNVCKLIAGSEGTLIFITEIKLNLIDLPPKEIAVVCVHCNSIVEAMQANIVAMQHKPMASELVDKLIMDFTIHHPEYGKNRFFIKGNPAAILMVEFMEEFAMVAQQKAQQLIHQLQEKKLGFAYPVLYNEESKFAWDIRKAGLGLLRNLKGDAQPVNLIEDCAVAIEDLPNYVSDVEELLAKYEVKASYYAHAGAGELHIEPIINLKTKQGLQTFRNILAETTTLVKKYKGSLSGEHGDGRLRGEYIAKVVGNETYELFRKVKEIFDPHHIFNAGKIVDAPAMDEHLRVKQQTTNRNIQTTFSFNEADGILKLTEKCSGSGDCRKTNISGGVMCPSYMATRLEKDTTRARANVLRQFLSNEVDEFPFNHEEIKEVMDLCLSCKGCKTECPSGVDVAKMKAEFLQHYYDKNGVPFRANLIAKYSKQMQLVSKMPWLFNAFYNVSIFRKIANQLVGFHPNRSMPKVANQTLLNWNKERKKTAANGKDKIVYFFCDEFTNYNDAAIGQKAIQLLEALGYEVFIPHHLESGRTFLSKGLVKKAKTIINTNIELLYPFIKKETPLIGLEPSAILTFRDEAKDLATQENYEKAVAIAQHTFTIEEFLANEFEAGKIDRNLFTTNTKQLNVHGHCYQKALSNQQFSKVCLEIPVNYKVTIIPSGCCGMAGGFGYEKEHFEVSQQVGELVLFPTIRNLKDNEIIVAAGTSCRHQIKDGTHQVALHPVEVLWNALKH